jgi:hypothetical protein
MKKIILCAGILLAGYATAQTSADAPYNVIPPTPESSYKSKFGNTDVNDFKGEPIVNIPLFSTKSGDIPFGLDLRYLKAGVKVNEISNATGINWVLNTGGIITRTINDIADEKVSRNLFSQIPNIGLDNPQNWGAYVIQNNYDHEVDIFNFTVGGYSGSFYLDQNFQPVILTKDNNCKVEVVGTFNQNYEFKVTTNDGIVYNFGGTGFTEKTFNKDDSSSAGVTSFYLKTITDIRNNVINFQYEDVGVLRSIITDIQENFNTQADVVMEPACGGHPLPSSTIDVKNNFLKISDPKRIKKVIFEDKSISFNYSSDYVFYNKLDNIQVAANSNVIKKYSFDYLDKFNTNNQLQRFFLTNIKFYENPTVNSVPVNEYILEYDNPSELPERLSKSIDYLGYYNGTFNGLNTLLPNLNLFNDTNIPAFDNFADRRPLFELAKYGSLKSITYPTKGKTIFEYEPIREAPRNEEFWMNGINPQHQTDTKYALPYELFDGAVQYTFGLYSLDQNVNTPALKARAIFRVYDEQNNLVHASEQITISKATIGLSRSVDGQFTLDRTKKYRFTLEVQDNLCSNCEGYVHMDVKKLSTEHGPGIRLKKQYDISENDTVNVKRIYYTNFSNIPIRYKENNIFVPGFTNSFLLKTASPNPETSTGCDTSTISYPGASTLVRNIKSTPNVSSLEQFYGDTDEKYLNLNDPMYSNITLSFGGDNFENGGEEKEYYIKLRNDIDRKLFAPSFTALGGDQIFVGSASNLSELIQSAKERFHRSFSFSNVDGKLLSDKVFKVENDNIKYIRTSENKYIFNEDTKLYNILGADIYPASTGDPYGLKNKYIASLPVSVDEVFLDETTSTDIPDPSYPDKKIVQNVKNYYNNPNNQLTKETITSSDNSITETIYKYASEKNNQLMISKNMVGIPLESIVVEKQNISDAGKTVSRTETIYPDQGNYPTAEAGNLLLPLSVKSYDALNASLFSEVKYHLYDNKGNLRQYITNDGKFVTIIWGYHNTQPIAKIEGGGDNDFSSFPSLATAVTASDVDSDQNSVASEQSLLNALDTFRSNLSQFQVTTYSYDPLVGVRSITPPSGIREFYKYDSANRLEKIMDVEGKVLKTFKYNYKN